METNESLMKMKKVIKIDSLVVAICFVASSFCFFINQMWIPLGFIIGYIVSVLNMVILYNFSYYLTRPRANYHKLNFFSYISRLLLYGVGFAICIIPQYFGFNIFFWGTCFASYMIMLIVLVIAFK